MKPAASFDGLSINSGDLERRIEVLIYRASLIISIAVVVLAERPLETSAAAAGYLLLNLIASKLRQRSGVWTRRAEVFRTILNVPAFGLVLWVAGIHSPAWLLGIAGALWVPLVLRHPLHLLVNAFTCLGWPLLLTYWQHPNPGPLEYLLPALVLTIVGVVPITITRGLAAHERSAATRILDSVVNTVLTTDTQGAVRFVNRAGSSGNAHRWIGSNITDLMPEHDRPRVQRVIDGVLRTGLATVFETDGREHFNSLWIKVHVSPLAGAGELRGLVFVLADISEQKTLERELRRARDDAERLSRSKSEFLAMVNHEVRTPINALLAGLALLQKADAPRSTEETELLRIMQISGDHLRQQVNSMLDMSRFSHKKELVERVPFDLYGLIEELIAMYSLQTASGVSLSYRIAADVPCRFISDALRWQTILRNLLSNAVKFTKSGTILLEVAWSTELPGQLRISVSDSGPGIAVSDREAIFEPFIQLDSSPKTQRGGVGLGLSLCNANAQLLGGRIILESEVGRGSTFSCVLPVEACPDWISQGRIGSACTGCPRNKKDDCFVPIASRELLRDKRVLIIEDEEVNRTVLEKLLQREGISKIAAAATGAAGLQILSQQDFDILLLDMHLPDVTGIHVAREARARGWRGTLVAVTADTTPHMRELLGAAGIDAMSPKPIDLQHLLNAMLGAQMSAQESTNDGN